jgi:superfamily II DNA/RNA helicase
VPTHAEDYVHRIGRTGRAGRSGHAFTLAAPEDGKYIAGIEKLAGKEIPRVDIEDIAEAELKEESGKSRRGKKASAPKSGKKEAKGDAGTKEDRKGTKVDKKQSAKDSKKEKSSRRGSRQRQDSIGDAPDHGDIPFGQTDQVPAFLKRSAAV